MNAEEIVRGLRYEQKKREKDFVDTCQTDVSAMCRDSADCIESLQAQLAESQRREQAAMKDIHICCATCAHCAKPTCPGGKCNFQGYEYWQWRGPQEAGDTP